VFLPTQVISGDEQTKLTSKALNDFNPSDYDVALMISETFLKGCGGVKVSEAPGELISSFDPISGDIKFPGLQHINFASVAKVCETDIVTVEMVMKEIVAQIQYQLKKGSNLRLMFKIGKLISKHGEITWKTFREEDKMNRTFHGDPTLDSRAGSNYSKIMVGSQYRKDMSVMTPSITKTRAFSQNTSE